MIFTLFMIVVAYLKEGTTNEPLTIERPVEKHTETIGIVPAAFVSEALSNVPPPDVVMHCPKTDMPTKTFFDEVVECFSLRKNFQILTNTNKPSSAVPIVDGLK